ncbi:hypothetical protein A9Q99_16665 [Gammaproteobacteria bacterium 45_16_T64]|nr:hypothetical protein A9Q99_16665 [Gammaproteobacteria bacterium 45_16_T64]
MSTRKEKKALTRSALINAALQLVEEGGNFATISIREIAKQAGIVPTAFYRHFKDTNELGLNLVDELSVCLRQLIRSAREQSENHTQLIQESIKNFDEHLNSHRELFVFMTQGRSGGTPPIRNAIRNELNVFALEIVNDLAQQQSFPTLTSAQLKMVADLIVSTLAYSATDLLDLHKNPVLKNERLTLLESQCRIIFLGAAEWKSA